MIDAADTNVGEVSAFVAAIDRMHPVGLLDINQDAELLTRTDRKYVVTNAELDAFVENFADGCSVLHIGARRSFGYSSTYHDTPDRRLHRDTAYRRPKRFKVRVREYTDTGVAMLEVKAKNGRGRTVKHRVDLSKLAGPLHAPHDRLTAEMRTYVDAVVDTDLTDRLEPTLRVDFRRTTLLAPAGDSRCTIDLGLHTEDPDGNALDPDVIVIETKSDSRASAFDRWLWAHGVRPTPLSKYCTSMAALDASLPANQWHRPLGMYFPPRQQRPA